MRTVAVIGAGNRGATHLDTISRLTDLYRLVGVCDAREDRRAWAHETYGAPVFEHPLTLLDEARPEVVAIVVPPDAHHLLTAAAAARGCHVLSETPIATTLAMAGDMIARCRAAGVVLEVAENVWRFPQERLKRRAVEAGLIGQVQQVHLWYRSGSYHGTNALRRFLPGRPLRALGVSRPFAVVPYRDLDGQEQRVQTWELGVIEFEGGQTAVYQWPVGSDRGNLWEVVGDAGAIMGTDIVLFDGPQGRRRRLALETVVEEAHGAQTGQGRPALVALRWDTGESRPPVVWENPYRRYNLATADEVARADVYAGLHEQIDAGDSGDAGVAGETDRGWPASPPADARFYGGPNARADQELLMALRESARRDSAWVDLPLPPDEPTAFERQLHQEFQAAYGTPPFSDPEALLGRLFPRRGLQQTVH
jgi:predicted dehydrogenase